MASSIEIKLRVSARGWTSPDEMPPLPAGVSMRGPIPIERYQAADVPDLLGFVITLSREFLDLLSGDTARGLAIGVASCGIYDLGRRIYGYLKKGGAHRVQIDRQQVPVEESQIGDAFQTIVIVYQSRHGHHADANGDVGDQGALQKPGDITAEATEESADPSEKQRARKRENQKADRTVLRAADHPGHPSLDHKSDVLDWD